MRSDFPAWMLHLKVDTCRSIACTVRSAPLASACSLSLPGGLHHGTAKFESLTCRQLILPLRALGSMQRSLCMLLSLRSETCCMCYLPNLCKGAFLQISLVNMLYQKSLRINQATKGALGVGKIVNLQSNDAAKLWGLAQYLHILWSGPFQVRERVLSMSGAPKFAVSCWWPSGDPELKCGFIVCAYF